MEKKKLPIYELEDDIVKYLQPSNRDRLIIEAPTGSGKSTQLPQILINNNVVKSGGIVVLQPRRVAARMLARRVAGEMGCRLGEEIGYQVRFEKMISDKTKVRFVTEGILIRELISNSSLSHVGAIVFDEFHERHIYSDVLLAIAKKLQEETRPDLKIVVMSATLSTKSIAEYLSPCQSIKCSGRTYPVDVRHVNLNVNSQTISESVIKAIKSEVIKKGLEGDVLIFLPGAFEIRKTIEKLRLIKQLKGCLIVPLYGDLNPNDQDYALQPSDKRKLIVSTNIAETSLTIDGVKIVIDCGLARIPSYDDVRGINTLLLNKISVASADQRAGRAGRVSAGSCIRLWSESDHAMRDKELPPEIKRLDLTEIVLLLAVFNSKIIDDLKWLDPPSKESMSKAKEFLVSLNAISRKDGSVTPIGKMMSSYPVHPRFARMIIEAGSRGCLNEVALSMALIQGRNIFDKKIQLKSSEFAHKNDISDFQPMIRAWIYAYRAKFDYQKCHAFDIHSKAAREVLSIFRSLTDIAKKQGLKVNELSSNFCGESMAKVFLVGFYDNLYRKLSKSTLSCELVGSRRGKLEKGSLADASDIGVAAEVNEIEGKDVSVVISKSTSIKLPWLKEVLGNYLTVQEISRFDKQRRRVITESITKCMDLVIDINELNNSSNAESANILASEIIDGKLKLKGWNDKCNSWILRVEFVSQCFPEYEIPIFTEIDKLLVLTDFCEGALSYKEIKDKQCWPYLEKWLSPIHSQTVKKYAPDRIKLENGIEAKVLYTSNGPKISVVLQRLYDINITPLLCNGKIPVSIEVLGPNHRPVQTTTDIARFWKESYPDIKKQLKGRYPKHEWR